MMAFVKVKGRRISYDESLSAGDASTLTAVCVHGSGGDREDWKAQVAYAGEEFRVIAVDLPGHGLSEPPGETSVSAYANWIVSFIEELGLQNVAPMGCSLGSAVALSLALNPRPWLRGLVLVGSGARLRVLPSVLQGLRDNPEAALMNLGRFSLAPSADQPLKHIIDAKFRAAGAHLIHADLSACDRFDVMGELERISVPTSVIVGEYDQLTPVKYAQYLTKHIPHAEMTVIKDAGHLVMMEQPEAFNGVMGDFLAGIGQRLAG